MVGGEVEFQTVMPESYIHRRKKRRKEGRKVGWPVESVAVARTHSWSQKSKLGSQSISMASRVHTDLLLHAGTGAASPWLLGPLFL